MATLAATLAATFAATLLAPIAHAQPAAPSVDAQDVLKDIRVLLLILSNIDSMVLT